MTTVPASGLLVLAGAPLGRPDDASPRLRALLGGADVIAAEDTRRFARLVSDLEVTVTGRVLSYFEGNEQTRTPTLLADLQAGKTVVVITDGGMPSVSDPGFRLVAAAVLAGVVVTCVPGPSAVTTALAVSGLPCDRFTFEGFLPRTGGPRRQRIASLADEKRTMVLFESPRRIGATLADLADAFGPLRPAVVCRELTKTYEEVRRGTLAELARWAVDGLRGEVTLVVAGAPERTDAPEPADLVAQVVAREAAGMPRKEAIAEVARTAGVPKREVFDAVVAAKLRG